MTQAEKVKLLKAMVGESDSEEVLLAYLDIAGRKILNRAYPFDNNVDEFVEVPARYAFLQCEIASYLLNKRGAEGETAHNENGINRSYENGGVPDSMLKQVVPFCGVPGGAGYEGASS